MYELVAQEGGKRQTRLFDRFSCFCAKSLLIEICSDMFALALILTLKHIQCDVLDSLYPENSLSSPGSVYPLDGQLPSARIHHTLALSSSHLLVYGGYDITGHTLGDVQLYDLRSQTWSNAINRSSCCDEHDLTFDAIGINTNGESMDTILPYLKDGFQGDYPLPRAEHSGCVLADEQFYVFGGLTDYFTSSGGNGEVYLNDLHVFDPLLLTWSEVFVDGSTSGIPSRRAGHSMTCTGQTLYVIGGRRDAIGLSDVWAYTPSSHAWMRLDSASSGRLPARQYAAVAMNPSEDKIYLFGGADPSSGVIYADLWMFTVSLGTWQHIAEPPAAGGYAYGPPGLLHATLMATDDQNLLLYGGLGSGGLCYDAVACSTEQTLLGQLYAFELTATAWIAPLVDMSDTAQVAANTHPRQWAHAQLSSASSSQVQQHRKTFAMEETVYDPLRRLLYEVGAVQALSLPSPDGTRNTPLYSSSGGYIVADLSNTETGEVLMTRVPLISNAFWNMSANGLAQGNKQELRWLRALRKYSVSKADMVLIMEESV